MISKVIFIICCPVREQEYDYLGIELLERNNYSVEIWNVMPIINPESFRYQGDVTSAALVSGKYILISKKEDFESRISGLDSNCFLFIQIGCSLKTYFIYRAITRKKLRYGNDMNLLESYHIMGMNDISARARRVTVKKIIARMRWEWWLEFIFRFVRPYVISPSNLISRGGNKSLQFVDREKYIADSSTKTLLMHNMDYDAFLMQKDKPKLDFNKNIAVFIDADPCFHPNYVRSNVKRTATPDVYFPELCDFFRKIEIKWDVEVIIAKHPRGSDEYACKDYFQGRRIISHRTCELIANSQFVVLHTSMAIDFAVLFNKPAIFIITEQLQKGLDGLLINCQAHYFGKKPVNISSDKEVSEFLREERLEIDEDIYNTYKDDVIKTPGTPEKLRWEIIIDYLKTL